MGRCLLVVLLLALLLSGCSGSDSSDPVSYTIAVTPSSAAISPGTSTRFQATGTYSDGRVVNLTESVTWSSSNPAVAIISNAAGTRGAVTALGLGSSTVSATLGTVSGSATLTAAAVQLISITPPSQEAIVGTTVRFGATALLATGDTQDITGVATWSTSDASIATANTGGAVSAVAPGSVTVLARWGGVTGTAGFNSLTVVSIALAPSSPSLDVGSTKQFTALGTLSNGTLADVTTLVTWNSGNTAILTVAANGQASAVGPGATTIGASYPGITTRSTTVTVLAPSSISVTPANPVAVAGSTPQFTAMGSFADGSSRDLTTLVTWSSSLPAVATISDQSGSKGVATAVGNGSTIISATLGAQGSTTLTVRTPSSLAITPANPTVVAGSTLQLAAVATFPDNSTQEITNSATWSSSAPEIASVSDVPGSKGVVSGVAIGSATITATVGAVSTSRTVTVIPTAIPSTRAFVSNTGSGNLSVVDTAANTLLTNIRVGAGPRGVAVDPSTNLAYVANFNGGTVSMVDLVHNEEIGTIGVGGGPSGVALDQGAQRLYVTNSQSGTLSVIDTSTGTVAAIIPVGSNPAGVAVNSATRQLYVANFGSNTVSVIDGSSHKVLRTIPVGQGPTDVAVNSSTSRAYVANSFSSTLSVISTASNSVVTSIAVGTDGQGIEVDPAAKRAYLTRGNANVLTVIDTGNNTVIGTVPVGAGPKGVAVKPDTGLVYVANSGGSVSVVDPAALRVIAIIPGFIAPSDIAVVP